MIRVGRRIYKGSKFVDPSFEGFIPILCLTKSSPYGDLGPYVMVTKDNVIFENYYQFSKLYKYVPYSKQTYSRYDSRVIWEHPSEVHVDSKGNPTEEYWKWRQKGFECKDPVRYPVGMQHRNKCLCSLWEKDPEEEEKEKVFYELDYIDSRKFIYLSKYVKLVSYLPSFQKLKKMLEKGKNLLKNILIIEVDGPHEESLEYYKKEYKVKDNFIENNTMLATKENLEIMLNDKKHPFGHGYCLAWALLGLELPVFTVDSIS